jgi:PTS system D-glucosamine-specific IIC component
MLATILTLYTSIGPHVVGTDGAIDLIFWGIIPQINGGGSNWYMVLVISGGFAIIYFFTFTWAIKKFNLSTPGRNNITKLFTKKDYQASKIENDEIDQIIKAYGTKDNIVNVDACFTRLRIEVKDSSKVDDNALKALGALGISRPAPRAIHAIFGTKSDILKNKIKERINI